MWVSENITPGSIKSDQFQESINCCFIFRKFKFWVFKEYFDYELLEIS